MTLVTRAVKDAIRHRAPYAAAAFVAIRHRLRDRRSPYAALDRAHRVSHLLGPDAQIQIDRTGVWLRDAQGRYWRHVPGVYGPFLGLERGHGFETAQLNWAATILPAGSVLVDIGANIGLFCINAILNSENTSALAIEPATRTYRSLSANIARNGLSSRITAIRAAVGEEVGQVMITAGLHAANHIVTRRRHRPAAAEELVPQTSLDKLVSDQRLDRVDLVKIDVEGFELSVLKGAVQTLQQLRPAVMMEIEARWTRRYGYTPVDIMDFMRSCGYEYHVIADRVQPGSGDLHIDLARGNNFAFVPQGDSTG